MKARLQFHEKRIVVDPEAGRIAVAEIKIWKVPKSNDYPSGKKFSLFLVFEGQAVIGIDNHKPKGPHRHVGDKEFLYEYVSDERLLSDFWHWVREEGFQS